MKTRKQIKQTLFLLAGGFLFLAQSSIAGTSAAVPAGIWSAPSTWSSGLPVDGASVGIGDDSEITFQTGDSWTGGGSTLGLIIGYGPWAVSNWGVENPGNGTLNVTGGTLNTGFLALGDETSVTASGTLNISGGTVNNTQDLRLGWNAPGSAINITGGTFTQSVGAFTSDIGFGAAATFAATGGVTTFSRATTVSNNSIVNVGGTATVNASAPFFVASGTVNQSAGALGVASFAGTSGSAAYNFTGGTLRADGDIDMTTNGITTSITGATGSGSTFDTNGNTVTVNAAQINIGPGGILTKEGAGTLAILNSAYFQNGTWNVNAGTVDTAGFFGAAVNVAGGTLNITRPGGTHLSYATNATNSLSSGAINVASALYLGNSGSGTAVMNQSGGTLAVQNQLLLGGDGGSATYNQTGGSLEAADFISAGGTNTYNFSGGTFKSTGNIDMTTNGITTSITGATGSGSTFDTNGNTVTVNAAQINLGSGGVLTKEGAGSLAILNNAYFQNGTWNVNAGTVDTVGFFGAAVNVAGGTLNVARGLGNHLSYATNAVNTLSSGAINATGDLYLGNANSGTAVMNQSGGSLDVSVALFLGGSGGSATYNQTGGAVTVGRMQVFANSTYDQALGTFAADDFVTVDSTGTLRVDGTITTPSVNIASGGLVGGDGLIVGSLDIASGGLFQFSLTDTLTVNDGMVTFGGLSIMNISGLDSSIAAGTYTLIDGTATFDFTNVSNFGLANAADLGGGKSAYFQSGSLQIVVVPEPSSWMLLGFGLGAIILVRRFRKQNA